jgi:hypothetical protein
MRGKVVFLSAMALLSVAACDTAGDHGAATATTPRKGLGVPDLVGTPDLVVDAKKLASSWTITTEDLAPNLCSVLEGDVPPGTHQLLRFTVTTPNIGDADVAIGDPRRHIDPNGDGNFSDSDGLFEFATCHAHFHFRNYAKYEMFPVLADGSLGTVIKARKRGFCMIDTTPYQETASPKERVYASCGDLTRPGNQGISVGYADTYVKQLGGQYFVLDDPAEPVPPGQYVLRITVNPGFVPVAGEPCPVVDSHGLCHNFREANFDNNVGQITLTVPDRNGKSGGTVQTATDWRDDENRPTK